MARVACDPSLASLSQGFGPVVANAELFMNHMNIFDLPRLPGSVLATWAGRRYLWGNHTWRAV